MKRLVGGREPIGSVRFEVRLTSVEDRFSRAELLDLIRNIGESERQYWVAPKLQILMTKMLTAPQIADSSL